MSDLWVVYIQVVVWFVLGISAKMSFQYSLKFDLEEDREGPSFSLLKESMVCWFLEWLKLLMWAKSLAECLGMLQKGQ